MGHHDGRVVLQVAPAAVLGARNKSLPKETSGLHQADGFDLHGDVVIRSHWQPQQQSAADFPVEESNTPEPWWLVVIKL